MDRFCGELFEKDQFPAGELEAIVKSYFLFVLISFCFLFDFFISYQFYQP